MELIAKISKRRIGVIAHGRANDPMAATAEFFRDDDGVSPPTGQQADGLRQSRMFYGVRHGERS